MVVLELLVLGLGALKGFFVKNCNVTQEECALSDLGQFRLKTSDVVNSVSLLFFQISRLRFEQLNVALDFSDVCLKKLVM